MVGLVYLGFFRIIPLLIASAKLNLCFQGFLRAVKLFSWNYGPETAVGSGQWDLGSLLLWGLRSLTMVRGQGAQEIPGTRTNLLGYFWCSKD